jgi:hypothetical protein
MPQLMPPFLLNDFTLVNFINRPQVLARLIQEYALENIVARTAWARLRPRGPAGTGAGSSCNQNSSRSSADPARTTSCSTLGDSRLARHPGRVARLLKRQFRLLGLWNWVLRRAEGRIWLRSALESRRCLSG